MPISYPTSEDRRIYEKARCARLGRIRRRDCHAVVTARLARSPVCRDEALDGQAHGTNDGEPSSERSTQTGHVHSAKTAGSTRTDYRATAGTERTSSATAACRSWMRQVLDRVHALSRPIVSSRPRKLHSTPVGALVAHDLIELAFIFSVNVVHCTRSVMERSFAAAAGPSHIGLCQLVFGEIGNFALENLDNLTIGLLGRGSGNIPCKLERGDATQQA
jgi:hypothetical protein